MNFLADYFSRSLSYVSPESSGFTASYRAGRRSFLLGPTAGFRIGRGWPVEGDALYRPIRPDGSTVFTYGGQTFRQALESSLTTWEFPVLAHYKFPGALASRRVQPFALAGPSFRVGGSASHYGATAGAGMETPVWKVKLAPSLRYSRWQTPSYGSLKSDELNLLVGVTF